MIVINAANIVCDSTRMIIQMRRFCLNAVKCVFHIHRLKWCGVDWIVADISLRKGHTSVEFPVPITFKPHRTVEIYIISKRNLCSYSEKMKFGVQICDEYIWIYGKNKECSWEGTQFRIFAIFSSSCFRSHSPAPKCRHT